MGMLSIGGGRDGAGGLNSPVRVGSGEEKCSVEAVMNGWVIPAPGLCFECVRIFCGPHEDIPKDLIYHHVAYFRQHVHKVRLIHMFISARGCTVLIYVRVGGAGGSTGVGRGLGAKNSLIRMKERSRQSAALGAWMNV